MKIDNFYLEKLKSKDENKDVNLILMAFSGLNKQADFHQQLSQKYPNAEVLIFSTAGHFISDTIEDEKAVVTAITFEKSEVEVKGFEENGFDSNYELGKAIAKGAKKGVKGVLVLSDGGLINGTELINGIDEHLDKSIDVFGGMAGDGTRFLETFIGLNEEPRVGVVATVYFYGEALSIKSNHDTSWTSLGIEFLITKSHKNILVELNEKNAYETLYEYLGSKNAEEFTKDTLYYPFLLKEGENDGVIRTPIFVDHEKKTLTYAGNMPEGETVRLMKSGTMQLLDASFEVAKSCRLENENEELILAISCVGRRVVLEDMANEEYTELSSVFGADQAYFGFYSYGEFSRSGFQQNCKLHNQTLTIAVLAEN